MKGVITSLGHPNFTIKMNMRILIAPEKIYILYSEQNVMYEKKTVLPKIADSAMS